MSLGRRRPILVGLLLAQLLLFGAHPLLQAQEPKQPKASDERPSSAMSGASAENAASPKDAAPPSAKSPVTPPKLLRFVEATYPPKALESGLQARVELELTITDQGLVSEARVVTAAGHGFDQAALDAVRQFVFEPARVGGKSVAVRVLYPYIFEIREVPKTADQTSKKKLTGTLRGKVFDRQAEEPLAGAVVTLSSEAIRTPVTTTSDKTGEFTLADLAPGPYTLKINAEGFVDFEQLETAVGGEVSSVVYRLEPVGEAYAFGAVARIPPPPREVTRRTMEKEQLTRIAGTRGDPLRAIEIMPGVARSPFGMGQLVVRGSAPGDTRNLFEGLPVELLYHFGGLTSFINPRLVDRIDFYPGNFSVRYGRATGGIVETRVVDPKLDSVHGVADVNLLDASLLVQVPVTQDGSLSLAARRSYIDVVLENTLSSDTMSMLAAPVYWDYQAIGSARVSERDRVRIMAYGSSDKFKLLFEQPESGVDAIGNLDLRLQFHRVSASWNRRLSHTVDQDLDISTGVYNTHFSFGRELYFDLQNIPINGRAEWRVRLSPIVRVIAGLDVNSGPFKYTYRGPRIGQTEGADNSGDLSEENRADLSSTVAIFYPAVYLESDLDLKPFRLVLGSRIDYFNNIDQFSFDPRLVVFYSLTSQITLKAGVGLFSLFPQGYETAPGFGNKNLKPNRAAHVSAGSDYQIVEGISLGLEGFYKYLFQRVVSTEFSQPPYFINDGIGRVYGLELLAKAQPKGRFFGYLSYTLSRSERRDRDEDWRLFDFDQPHIITASGVYRAGRGWEFGATFRLVSGNLMTPIREGMNDLNLGSYRPIWGPVNSTRAKLFHRLDLRVEKMWKFKGWSLALYLDLQNAYNATNQEGLIYDYRLQERTPLSGLPILPVLGLRGEL
jgi:TonB family protein